MSEHSPPADSVRLGARLRRLVRIVPAGFTALGQGLLLRFDIGRRYAALSYEVWQAEGFLRLLRRVGLRLLPGTTGSGRYRPPAGRGTGHSPADSWHPLHFEQPAQPRVSIIIPVHNQHLHTFTCLRSIAAAGADLAFELIVVDDRSSDATPAMLAAMSGIRRVSNRDEPGFVAACNTGAAEARGEILVFLNNDTIVTPGWLDALAGTFDRYPQAGLVGARLLYPDGRLQEAGCILWRDASAWNYGRGDDPDRPEYNYLRDVDYCSGACLAVPADLFRELGGFGHDFMPAYYEDADLALKVRAAGRRVLYQPGATVVHFEGASAGRRLTGKLKQHQIRNQRTLRAKWAAVLDHHRVNGVQPEREKDRGVQRRVLVIDAAIPTPDRDSGSLRMSALLELFRELGFGVSFAAAALDHGGEYGAELRQRGVEVLHRPHVGSIDAWLAAHGKRFDVIVLSRVDVADRYLALARAHAPAARLIFDTVDLRFLREARFARLRGSSLLDKAAASREARELALARQADATLVVSPAEQELLRQRLPGCRVELVSNIVLPRGPGPGFAERRGAVFIGSFNHPPNVDAVLHYCKEILPLIRREIGPIGTWIIGDDPPPRVRALAADGVTVTGHVADLSPYLDRCLLTVAPLRYGAGVKGKVNTSMAHGVPVVATPVAAEGMRLTDGYDVLIADEPADFAGAVVRLHRDAALWNRLSANGLANLREHFSPAAARAGLLGALGAAAGGKPETG